MFARSFHIQLPRRVTAYFLLFGLTAVVWLSGGSVLRRPRRKPKPLGERLPALAGPRHEPCLARLSAARRRQPPGDRPRDRSLRAVPTTAPSCRRQGDSSPTPATSRLAGRHPTATAPTNNGATPPAFAMSAPQGELVDEYRAPTQGRRPAGRHADARRHAGQLVELAQFGGPACAAGDLRPGLLHGGRRGAC